MLSKLFWLYFGNVAEAETLEVSRLTSVGNELNGKSSKAIAIVALKAPALEIDMISEEPEPSGYTVDTVLEDKWRKEREHGQNTQLSTTNTISHF